MYKLYKFVCTQANLFGLVVVYKERGREKERKERETGRERGGGEEREKDKETDKQRENGRGGLYFHHNYSNCGLCLL